MTRVKYENCLFQACFSKNYYNYSPNNSLKFTACGGLLVGAVLYCSHNKSV